MATWPSGTKASTTNLDAGTDRPSLARPDIKQNVDNVNAIIDMFDITAPSDGEILKYNVSNTRFELASDADLNTTYTISAEADGANANLRLTGSDSSTDDIQLVAGTNITLTVDSAGAVTIDAAGGSGGITTVTPGVNIDVTEDSAGGVTVSLESVVDGIELKDYKETVYALSYAATITPDVANGNVQEITLTGNVAFGGFSNVEDGQTLTLIIHQDGTGSRLFSESLSSADAMLFAGGDSTLTTAGGSTDIMSIIYTGGIYYASLAKDFS
jgi:hypothetical protein